jgi:holo-[acyl-carrier protein] synthase
VILGIGTDLIKISRIEKTFQKFGEKFVDRVLSLEEKIKFLSIPTRGKKINFLAKHFSSKESMLKALGIGMGRGVDMPDLTITYNEYGKPSINVGDKKIKVVEKILNKKIDNLNFLVSLTDEKNIVSTVSIIEGNDSVR